MLYRHYRFLFFIAMLTAVLPSGAQQPLNLGFETKSVEGSARPWGWSIDSYTHFEIRLDSTIKHGGSYSLCMTGKESPQQEEHLLGYGIEAYELLNQKIKIEGWIKTESLSGDAFFKLEYAGGADEKNKTPFDTASVKLSGTTDWTRVSVNIPMPAHTDLLYLSLCVRGTGKARFDDFGLFVNDKKISAARVAKPFSKKQVTWLENHSSVIRTVDASRDNEIPSFTDLAAFKKTAGNAQIIALGESTHGTSEFFRLKHRVLEYAVKEMGVRVFAIEDNQLIVEKVNRFVLTGEGTARKSMYGMFSVWQNREVHDMIQWVRNYNAKHPDDMVEFVGFDMQELATPLDSLYAFLERKDQPLFASVSTVLLDLKTNGNTIYMASDSIKKGWYENAVQALRAVSGKKQSWLALAHSRKDSMEIEWGLQYANLVKQFAQSGYRGHMSLYRDTAMAENVSWLLSMRKKGTKMLLWAHDNHVSRGEHPVKEYNLYNGISMGAHLAKKFGSSYKTFGISSFTGEYWAQISYSDFRQMAVPLSPGPEGSLDEALHRVANSRRAPGLFLDLSTSRREDWLAERLPVRFANHVNIEYGYWTRYSIPYQFDGIFFIDKTSAANSYSKK